VGRRIDGKYDFTTLFVEVLNAASENTRKLAKCNRLVNGPRQQAEYTWSILQNERDNILQVIKRDESASQVNPEDSTNCETETEQQVHNE
jgi:hypothetical protein